MMKKRIFCIGMLIALLAAVQVQAEEEDMSSSISIIGGADGPTSIFLAGKLDEESSEEAAQKAEDLYALKTEYVGNASALGSLIVSLTENGYLPPSKGVTFEILSEQEPYGLIIRFKEPLQKEEEAAAGKPAEEMEEADPDGKLMDCGAILLALVDNLSEVQFTYPEDEIQEETDAISGETQKETDALSGEIQEETNALSGESGDVTEHTLCCDVDWAEEWLGRNVKEYGESPEEFLELIAMLSQGK